MNFPHWVDAPRSKKTRATNRLKYLLSVLANNLTGRQSMRALSEHVGLDHSTISIYIRRGAFSEKAAKLIEEKLGRAAVRHEQLTDPLSIEKTG